MMTNRWSAFFLTLVLPILFFASRSLYAADEAGVRLTLDESVRLALENNIDLQKAAITLNSAKRAKNSSWNLFLPSISLSGGISNTQPIKPEGDASSGWNASGRASLGFAPDIPSQIQLLRATYNSAEAAYIDAREKLKKEIAIAFYNLLASQKNIEILRNNRDLLKTQYDELEKRYRNGLASELDMLNAQVRYRQSEPKLRDALATVDVDTASFLLKVGMDAKTKIVLQGDVAVRELKTLSKDELVETYLYSRTDVKNQEYASKITKYNAFIAAARNLMPSLSVSESISLTEAIPSAQNMRASGTFSLRLSIPLSALIPGSSESNSVKTSYDNANLAGKTYENAVKTAEEDIRKKTTTLESATESLEVEKLNQTITKRAYELSVQGYNSGLVSQTDLQSARQTLVDSQLALIKAEIVYVQSVYDLALALGLDIERFYALYAKN
ncbi:MAG: hypothetical protein Ta2A_21050 [Treponemataceae bacterium]|nr:MAG: hypothetical protein Ta2A_21050 [Treponemataceae bacterium]